LEKRELLALKINNFKYTVDSAMNDFYVSSEDDIKGIVGSIHKEHCQCQFNGSDCASAHNS